MFCTLSIYAFQNYSAEGVHQFRKSEGLVLENISNNFAQEKN